MEMLCTSHLHPSVVMLSPATGSPDGYCLYESYLALKKEGMGRPVVYPEAGDQWNNDHVSMLSPDSRKSQVSIDGSRLAGDKVVRIDNNMVLTPLKGTLIYRIMQGNSVKHTVSTTVDIHAGGRFELSIPAEASAKAKKNRSLDVSVSVNCADYCLPANFPTSEGNSKKTKNSPEAVIAFEKFVF